MIFINIQFKILQKENYTYDGLTKPREKIKLVLYILT